MFTPGRTCILERSLGYIIYWDMYAEKIPIDTCKIHGSKKNVEYKAIYMDDTKTIDTLEEKRSTNLEHRGKSPPFPRSRWLQRSHILCAAHGLHRCAPLRGSLEPLPYDDMSALHRICFDPESLAASMVAPESVPNDASSTATWEYNREKVKL